jgi:sulfur carrier protein
LIHLTINGNLKEFSIDPLTVQALVESLDLFGKRLAIELNGEIVLRSQFAQTLLQEGDQLEIVGAVGGG